MVKNNVTYLPVPTVHLIFSISPTSLKSVCDASSFLSSLLH